jgi:hypothetical protein
MEPPASVDQLPSLIKEWMAIERKLTELSAELREKRTQGKQLRAMIMNIMKGNKVGTLNISAGAVTTRTRTTKAPMSKKYLVSSLTTFFNGDATMAQKCADFLDQNRPLKSVDNLKLEPK